MQFVQYVVGAHLAIILALILLDSLRLDLFAGLATLAYVALVVINPTNVGGEGWRKMKNVAVALTVFVSVYILLSFLW